MRPTLASSPSRVCPLFHFFHFPCRLRSPVLPLAYHHLCGMQRRPGLAHVNHGVAQVNHGVALVNHGMARQFRRQGAIHGREAQYISPVTRLLCMRARAHTHTRCTQYIPPATRFLCTHTCVISTTTHIRIHAQTNCVCVCVCVCVCACVCVPVCAQY